MCTVSYIPLENGFILTSNRDEDPGRETAPPERISLANGRSVIAPRDKLKGGSWIAVDHSARAACLLNGAFMRHKRQLPYRKSRGQLVFEALEARDFESFIAVTSLTGIEPFTLLMFGAGQIRNLLWDGTRKYSWQLPAGSWHLWSSPTLYTPAQHAEKERYFKDALLNRGRAADNLLGIHGLKEITPFILNRPQVRTVSITQVEAGQKGTSLQYHLKPKNDEKATLVSDIVV